MQPPLLPPCPSWLILSLSVFPLLLTVLHAFLGCIIRVCSSLVISVCITSEHSPPPPSPECPQIPPVSPPQPLLQPAPLQGLPTSPPPAQQNWVVSHASPICPPLYLSPQWPLTSIPASHCFQTVCPAETPRSLLFSGPLSPGSMGPAFPKPCRPCALSQGTPSLSAGVLFLSRGLRGGPCLLHC